ncbi:MAG: hypothetical protein WKF67_11570 [Rubrobacteraceae bacterium]
MHGDVNLSDYERLCAAFDEAGVMYREADPAEADDLAARFGVRESVRRGDFDNGPREVLLARSQARTPGPVMLFDRDGNYVGLGDDRTNAALSPEFYGRVD